jgi:hypothetical protein
MSQQPYALIFFFQFDEHLMKIIGLFSFRGVCSGR